MVLGCIRAEHAVTRWGRRGMKRTCGLKRHRIFWTHKHRNPQGLQRRRSPKVDSGRGKFHIIKMENDAKLFREQTVWQLCELSGRDRDGLRCTQGLYRLRRMNYLCRSKANDGCKSHKYLHHLCPVTEEYNNFVDDNVVNNRNLPQRWCQQRCLHVTFY